MYIGSISDLAKRATHLCHRISTRCRHVSTRTKSLTNFSRCGNILRKSAPKTQKKEKDLSADGSVIRRQSKKGGSLIGRASFVAQGLCAGLVLLLAACSGGRSGERRVGKEC